MRSLFIILCSFFCFQATKAIDVDKRTSVALGYIQNGYIQYGFEELKKLAATNDLAAQFYVGVCYEHGIGVEKDSAEAFRMYRKAAERGLPDAMYHISSFYRDGVAVTQDIVREKEWLQRYNKKGGQFVLTDLISIYNEGVKHQKNYALNPHGNNGAPANQISQNTVSNTQKRQTNVQPQPIVVTQPQQVNKSVAKEKKSDVDMNIPMGKLTRIHTFALIIANENYMEVANVPNALNDGKVFAEYCKKTLGLPESNVRFVGDATLNKMKRQLSWLGQVMEAFKDEANIIFYYAGHGIPDESNHSSYLLPVDGYGSDVTTGYSLDDIYALLGKKNAKSVFVLLDACFSGANRDGSMLASARGVAIKAKPSSPKGKMVILSASQGDETAYPYQEKGHGMFTYYLLKKLKDTKGDVTVGELTDYVTNEVMKQSVVINGKMQTPQVIPSEGAGDWKKWNFK